jgi:hypothetical protein
MSAMEVDSPTPKSAKPRFEVKKVGFVEWPGAVLLEDECMRSANVQWNAVALWAWGTFIAARSLSFLHPRSGMTWSLPTLSIILTLQTLSLTTAPFAATTSWTSVSTLAAHRRCPSNPRGPVAAFLQERQLTPPGIECQANQGAESEGCTVAWGICNVSTLL